MVIFFAIAISIAVGICVVSYQNSVVRKLFESLLCNDFLQRRLLEMIRLAFTRSCLQITRSTTIQF